MPDKSPEERAEVLYRLRLKHHSEGETPTPTFEAALLDIKEIDKKYGRYNPHRFDY